MVGSFLIPQRTVSKSTLGVCAMQVQLATKIALQFEAFQDKENPADWRVEAIDIKAGDVYTAIFVGPLAEQRATEYAEFKNRN
jgi:hypothetical protein